MSKDAVIGHDVNVPESKWLTIRTNSDTTYTFNSCYYRPVKVNGVVQTGDLGYCKRMMKEKKAVQGVDFFFSEEGEEAVVTAILTDKKLRKLYSDWTKTNAMYQRRMQSEEQ